MKKYDFITEVLFYLLWAFACLCVLSIVFVLYLVDSIPRAWNLVLNKWKEKRGYEI
tara:strand:- start:173 stop:340 length:168 start_codon:yes stop_codon:yes gene_type:complete